MAGKKVVRVDEDEDLVVIKFNGLLYNDEDARVKLQNCKFHHLDTEEPVIQVGRQFFRGTLDNILGTSVCFEVPRDDSNDLKYVGKTEKGLIMNRVYLKEKSAAESTTGDGDNSASCSQSGQQAPCVPSSSEEPGQSFAQ